MLSTIDFSSLSLQDALDVALIIEAEAQERYGEMADQLEQHRTPEAAAFFRVMAGAEAKHVAALESRRKATFGDAPMRVDSSIVPEIEAAGYDTVRAFMNEHQALRIALASEVRAERFYAAALETNLAPEVKTLFQELRAEEVMHQQLVADRLSRLPPESELDPCHFVDPPVAQ